GLITALASFVDKNPQLRSRIRLTLLGEGAEQEVLKKTITQHAMEDVVCLAGFSADIENFLAGLHVYIQTSRYEGMCLAAHEAMNAGLAIITPPVGELKESVIDGHTGYILNGELTPALEEVLNRIFNEPTELQHYGQNARQYVLQKFSHENFVQSAINIVNRLIH
ncbi:glycosyltransferase, partial [Escherichia coli]|nr:glycosyltransferase [Escherichia coli]